VIAVPHAWRALQPVLIGHLPPLEKSHEGFHLMKTWRLLRPVIAHQLLEF
jgi:hypothetical protein